MIIRQGEEFFIEFTHSLYRVKQQDHYYITRDKKLVLSKVRFASVKAAEYYNADMVYRRNFDVDEYGWVVIHPNSELPQLRIKVGEMGDQRLISGHTALEIAEMAGEGHAIVVRPAGPVTAGLTLLKAYLFHSI